MITVGRHDVFGFAAAVTAAAEVGLLGALAAPGPHGAAALAAELGLDVFAVERALDVLVAAGVAVERDGGVSLDDALLRAHRGFPGGLGLTLGLFSTTAAWLRTGERAWATDGDASERATAYRRTVGGLGELFAEASEAFAEALPLRPRVVLDVGCGSGVWSLALAARRPGLRVIGLDLPPVLEVFAATARARGVAVECVGGDMHATALPRADVVLLANVLRLETEARAQALIGRLAGAVTEGGALVVVDAFAGSTPARELSRAVYALHLALRTRAARVHAPREVGAWMEAAGLRAEALDFGDWPGAVAAIIGRR